MLESPELQFHDSYVVIGGSGSGVTKSVKYVYADETVIMTPPSKDIKLPSIDASFVMTEASLKDVIKATGVLGLSDVAVVGDSDRVTLQALDSKNPTGDVYSVDVGETDKVFKAIFKAENLVRLLPTAYDVSLCSKGISQFIAQGSHETLSYFVAVESNSVFN